ncbi:hypothetical protein JOQ06_010234, partial [Pogonophryne albipinna]
MEQVLSVEPGTPQGCSPSSPPPRYIPYCGTMRLQRSPGRAQLPSGAKSCKVLTVTLGVEWYRRLIERRHLNAGGVHFYSGMGESARDSFSNLECSPTTHPDRCVTTSQRSSSADLLNGGLPFSNTGPQIDFALSQMREPAH